MKDRNAMDTDDYYAQARFGTQDEPQREYDPDEACDRDYIEEDIEEEAQTNA